MRHSALVWSALVATACAGSPRLTHTYPSGGQRGAEIEIACSGGNFADARELLFDTPASFKLVEFKLPEEKDKRLRAKIAIAADTRLGEHSYRIVTTSGISDARLFYVSPFPLIEEVAENKENPNAPQPIALGSTVYGRTQGEDMDQFEVEAKKGQRISAEVIAARLQTQQIFDTYLTISKADGTPLAKVDDVAFSRQDPVASIIAPEDGKYIIAVRDATNTGNGDCHYLLNIGSFPRPLAIYPAGGKAGAETKFTLIGDASGPIERTVKLPDRVEPKFQFFPEDGQPAPQPNLVRVSPFGDVLEVEPNDDMTKATPAPGELPLAFNGIIEKPGDVDFFKFTAHKDMSYDVQVYARRLRSPLDSVLNICDAKGGNLAGNDDSGQPDSYLRWKAPADGEFGIAITDQLKRGGPTYTYRVEITVVAPRMELNLPEMVQNSNQERRAIVVPKGNRYATMVRVKRVDVGGDLTLTPDGLPAGVTATAPTMDKSVDTVPVVFEAAPDAAPVAKTIDIRAALVEPPKDQPPVATAIENDIDVAENGNQKSFYAITEHTFAAAVTDEIPVKINLVQPKVPLLQNGTTNLKIVAERKGEFKGAINLQLLWTPPGLGTAGGGTIKEGENEGALTLSANGNAPAQKWKICIVGNAETGKGTVWFSTGLIELEIAPAFEAATIVRTFVDQGDEGSITVKLDPKIPFDGKAKLELLSLPSGVTAEAREITKDDKEVRVKITAAKDAQVGQHKQVIAQFTLEKDGEKMVNTIAGGGILRVDKASVAQK